MVTLGCNYVIWRLPCRACHSKTEFWSGSFESCGTSRNYQPTNSAAPILDFQLRQNTSAMRFSLKQYPVTLLALWSAGAIILILWSLLLCDGHLIYTLDDPYIHLRVAQIILLGGYGVNIGEFSSPSSSIIYPYLLAVTELAGFGTWGPLVVNMLAMAFAVYAVGHIMQDYVFTNNINDRGFAGLKLYSLGLGYCPPYYLISS